MRFSASSHTFIPTFERLARQLRDLCPVGMAVAKEHLRQRTPAWLGHDEDASGPAAVWLTSGVTRSRLRFAEDRPPKGVARVRTWEPGRGAVGKRTFGGVSLRYVALCDVLGFRALLADNGVQWLGEQYRGLTKDLAEASRYEARSHVFSDSVLMYTRPLLIPRMPLHREHLRHHIDGFLAWVAYVVRAAMERGLPLRGGVAAGPCAINAARQLFVGEAIVDAYTLEQQQDWAGVAIHDSCFTWCGTEPSDNYFRHVVQYPIPPNPGLGQSAVLEWSLAWPFASGGVDEDVLIRVAAIADQHVGGLHEARWRNTVDYVTYLTGLRRFS